MTPYDQFQKNVEATSHYRKMYRELRSLKKLGTKGKLSAENKYLMWLPRAMVVASMSALDAYVHQVLYDKIPRILADEKQLVPDHLAELIVDVAPLKKRNDVENSIRLIRSKNGPKELADIIRERRLQFESYQAPDKIVSAFKMIGIEDIFQGVADRWTGPNSSRDDITKRLSNFVKRRNQIAHEGDLETHHEPRAITPDYGRKCQKFNETLVDRINSVIY